jgi:hypothetical protein
MPNGLVIKIKPGGGFEVEADGYTGGQCLVDLQTFVEGMEQLGVVSEVSEQRKKPEMFADGNVSRNSY